VLTRPRLAAGPGGVDVRGLTGGVHLPWTRLRVRVRETRRLGMRSRTLELDTATGPEDDGVLVVLGRRDLGTDPEAVARALRALDPTAG
jgi:Bacterial PH domain